MEWAASVLALCGLGWLLGYPVWGSTAVRRALPMAAMRDVWGNKTREKNAPRRLSKKKLQRVTAAWTRVMILLVEQGAAGESPRLLLLAERKCEQLEQQLKETQVQAAKAEKEAKKELEAEKKAHRRAVNVLTKQFMDKLKRRESNHYNDMRQLQMQLDLVQDSLRLKEQDSWKLAEMEEQRAWHREMETSNCTRNGDPILETYEPYSMDGEAAGKLGAVVIDELEFEKKANRRAVTVLKRQCQEKIKRCESTVIDASDDDSTDLDESEAITVE